ncbi:MAG TPA: glutamine amidotransferase [Coleofasciculaceae cyanobacterium]
MKNAVAIRHVAFEDVGNLASALHRQGYGVTYLEASPGFLDEIDPLAPDLVVVLGGPIGAYDEQDYPFLMDELHLLEHRLAADLPTLGICLGAQLMARVLGAKVYPGSEKEIGWSPLELSEAGQQSPLSYLAPEYTAVLHWHGDTFDLPVGSTHLASSSKYRNQAFGWRDCGLALQFHPEVTARGLERWFIGHACEISTTSGVNITKLREDTARHGRSLEVQAAKFWQAWLDKLQNKEVPGKETAVGKSAR